MERARPGRPVFTVIGGPNGAGKSTYAEGLAARSYPLGEVVNPDMIAAVLPGPDATRDTRAGRETLKRTRALIANGQTFSRETTLSGSEILRTMQGAKEAGFTVNLFFVGVDSLETSRRRVEDRVSKGGHGYPPARAGTSFRPQLRQRGTSGTGRGYDGVCTQQGRTIPKRGHGSTWSDGMARRHSGSRMVGSYHPSHGAA